MIVYFADRAMKIIGQAGSKLKRGLIVSDDKGEDSLESGAKTLEFNLNYTERNHQQAKDISTAGNLVFYGEDKAAAYTIVDTEDDSEAQQINVYCEDAGLDMISGLAQGYSATTTLGKFAEHFLSGTGFEVGENDSTESKTIEWEDTATIVERLLDLAGQFGVEMTYSYEFDGMKVAKRYVNFYAKRGTNRHRNLRLGKEVTKIVEKKTIENLATALLANGGSPEGSSGNITLGGMKYDDGDIYLSGGILYCRSAKARWQKTGGNDILREYTDDSLSASTLLTNAVEALRKAAEIETTYEITVEYYKDPIETGDTVNVVDEDGKLFLESRVQKVTRSQCDETQELELGETFELKNATGERVRTGSSGGIASSDSFTTFGAAGTATALSASDTTVKNTMTGSNEFYSKTDTALTVKGDGRYMISVNGDFTGTGNVTMKVKKGDTVLQTSTGYVSGAGSVSFVFIDTFSANDTITLTAACGSGQTVSESGKTIMYVQKLT